jgi:hypothetical protein
LTSIAGSDEREGPDDVITLIGDSVSPSKVISDLFQPPNEPLRFFEFLTFEKGVVSQPQRRPGQEEEMKEESDDEESSADADIPDNVVRAMTEGFSPSAILSDFSAFRLEPLISYEDAEIGIVEKEEVGDEQEEFDISRDLTLRAVDVISPDDTLRSLLALPVDSLKMLSASFRPPAEATSAGNDVICDGPESALFSMTELVSPDVVLFDLFTLPICSLTFYQSSRPKRHIGDLTLHVSKGAVTAGGEEEEADEEEIREEKEEAREREDGEVVAEIPDHITDFIRGDVVSDDFFSNLVALDVRHLTRGLAAGREVRSDPPDGFGPGSDVRINDDVLSAFPNCAEVADVIPELSGLHVEALNGFEPVFEVVAHKQDPGGASALSQHRDEVESIYIPDDVADAFTNWADVAGVASDLCRLSFGPLNEFKTVFEAAAEEEDSGPVSKPSLVLGGSHSIDSPDEISDSFAD